MQELPQRLFGLILATPRGHILVAQVLAPTEQEAIICFQKENWKPFHKGVPATAEYRRWKTFEKSNTIGCFGRDWQSQVSELGGVNLAYVQNMTPGLVRYNPDMES